MRKNVKNNMFVKLIDSMGTDLSVVNAARVSFGKRKEDVSKGDEKLIGFLQNMVIGARSHIVLPSFTSRPLSLSQDNLSNIKSDCLGMKLVVDMLILMWSFTK